MGPTNGQFYGRVPISREGTVIRAFVAGLSKPEKQAAWLQTNRGIDWSYHIDRPDCGNESDDVPVDIDNILEMVLQRIHDPRGKLVERAYSRLPRKINNSRLMPIIAPGTVSVGRPLRQAPARNAPTGGEWSLGATPRDPEEGVYPVHSGGRPNEFRSDFLEVIDPTSGRRRCVEVRHVRPTATS